LTLFDPDLAADPPVGEGPGPAGAQPRAGPRPRREGPRVELPGLTTRLRLDVSYDGAGFRGFAAQPGQRTVAGELAAAVTTVVGHPVELVCAGRTDAGVHATGQVVHVDVRPGTDTVRLVRSVNSLVGPAVVLRSATVAPPGFDARRSALARCYRYLVLEAPGPDPLLAPLSWHVAGPLDLRAMRSGADALLGEHDFRAFCRRVPGTAPGTPIPRRVLDARFSEVPVGAGDLVEGARLLRFDIEATSFCHQMVRSVVGVLVDIGRGRRRVSDVIGLLRSGDRAGGGNVIAPPQGLCLTRVDYPA
jgi:tRNA pseudouridine38-40 synthase